jgi:hypothetical protein
MVLVSSNRALLRAEIGRSLGRNRSPLSPPRNRTLRVGTDLGRSRSAATSVSRSAFGPKGRYSLGRYEGSLPSTVARLRYS